MPQPPNQALPQTVALRFRDFGVDTIAEHNAIAGERGYVWWGWWNKPDERTPRDVLAHFEREILENGPLEIFLVDSGFERLFSARLSEIKIAPGVQPNSLMLPPEGGETVPAYYRDRQWRVWLRFDGLIEPHDDPEDIREYSYQEVSSEDFVDDPHLAAYDQKRVHSLREMLSRRHRTMYFLRRRRADDREAEIQLVAPDFPRAFSTEAHSAKEDYIIVLSDLHLSEDRTQHGYPLVSQVGDPNLLEILDADRNANFGGKSPAAVIVSGDLTWSGTPAEFEHARAFLSRLQSIWGLDWSQIILTPGNHDITWTTPQAGAGLPAGPEAEGAYRTFLSQTLRYTPGAQLSIGRRFLLGNFVPLDVVALNSVRLERDEYRGYGYVGADQVRIAFEEMGWERGGEPGPKLRILVLHHHVVPVVPVEKLGASGYSLTLDAGELLYTALDHGVDLILHGHQHKAFMANFGRTVAGHPAIAARYLPIHGVGSAGVASGHLVEGGRNAYSVLRFAQDALEVEVRERSQEHGHAFNSAWAVRLERTRHGFRPEALG